MQRRWWAALAVVGLSALGMTGIPAPGASASTSPVPAGGSITVIGHGNGHGHGMSQYGARGAALAGLSATQIVNFYYPNTTLTTLGPSTVRVLITNDGGVTRVGAKAGMSLSGYGALNPAGVVYWELTSSPDQPGLELWQLAPSGAWSPLADGLPTQADFSSANDGVVRLYHADGSSVDYRGTIGSVRSGATRYTINRVALDDYTVGVAPRESPASWPAAAEQAQAIAARSYARNAVESHTGSLYDICDTSNCQVYGGKAAYDASGNLLYSEYPAAITGNQNEVLTYGGATIFAQFSASDGGWTADGGKPYLIAQPDPYDNAASGDPYLNWTRTVSGATIAAYYGLSSVNAVEITARDGNGDWGGRVTAGYVDGLDGSGHAQRISTTGFSLQSAMGLPTNWFTIPSLAPTGNLESVSAGASAGGVSDQVEVNVGTSDYLVTASGSRPDVAAAYGLSSAAHGFSLTVAMPLGTATVCAYALNVGGTANTLLGCQTVTGPTAPVGMLELVGPYTNGQMTVTGWAFDPQASGASTRVDAYVDGTYAASTIASLARPDVQAAYFTASAAHGYSVSVPLSAGASTICLYAISNDLSNHTMIGCHSVIDPIGVVDSVTTGRSLTVSGWSFDPMASNGPDRVDIYLGGSFYSMSATTSRPDVAAAFGLSSAAHGFTITMPLPAGTATMCVYAVNVAATAHTDLGCQSVTGPTAPQGSVEAVSPVSGGQVTVTGWSLDPNDTSRSTRVDIYLDGAYVLSTTASIARPDVQAAYTALSAAHGFSVAVPVAAGAQTLCVYAISLDTSNHTDLACVPIG
jgi:SpoIID/LytB domain protein